MSPNDQSNLTEYDGFNFGANGITLTDISHLTIASRNNQLETIANRDGAVLVQSNSGTKVIQLQGYYIGTSSDDAQEMYDLLATAFNRQERPLLIPHAGGQRRYTATPQTPILSQPDGLNRLLMNVQFIVPSGKSEDINALSMVSGTITTGTTTLPLTIQGSVLARPLINLTFTSVTGGTAKSVSVRNAKDYIGLTFTRNFVSGDTISIDSKNFQVYINGVLTAPEGRMPTWSPGDGSLYYADTFSARSVAITSSYKPGYL